MTEHVGLPRRTVAELVEALRVRADAVTGQNWEAPATAAMMREAADALSAAGLLVEEMREDIVWRKANLDFQVKHNLVEDDAAIRALQEYVDKFAAVFSREEPDRADVG